uniref:Uncharacterized protein n=1 Tax=Odontella aurita TaxID=265563 RepID=A0A7S4JR54_9STRA
MNALCFFRCHSILPARPPVLLPFAIQFALTMEVASPLPFPHGQSGSKRRFAFSPGLDTTAIGVDSTQDLNMDDASTCHQPLFKRRRRQSHESNVAAGSSSGISAFPTFASPAFAALGTPQTKSGGEFIVERLFL